MTTSPERREPPPYLFAVLCGLAVFGIYVATLASTTAFWDTSEYIAAAYVLGIPHPPGNPFFTMLAHAWGALPIATMYAVRINLFAAATSAACAGLLFLVADRWMRNVVTVRWARLAASFAGILVGALTWTVWNQSTVNEKVYTVSMLSTALVLWLGVHWADDVPGQHRDRWLVLIGYILTLSSTNHMMGVLAAPAVAIYVVFTEPGLLLKPWALWLGVLVALAVSGKGAALVDGPASDRAVVAVALLVLTAYANGVSVEQWLPAARSWPRPARLRVTLDGRADFALHFLISALLAIDGTSPLSKEVGVYKELADARTGSGFSFNDIAANRAGTRLGRMAVAAPGLLQERAAASRSDLDLLPDVSDLPEFMSAADFQRRYGTPGSADYERMMREIEARLGHTPLLQPAP